jgi:hypothetical protein
MTHDDLTANLWRIFGELETERALQDAEFGTQHLEDGIRWVGDEPAMRAARKTCEFDTAHGTLTWRVVLWEEVREAFAALSEADLRNELIQVAAVAVAWIEDIDRRNLSA